ncbi:MAG: sodium:proton antiporter NhaD [Flavobacteriia bacterium]|nr:sodium:proton antiporter NhaD [Flavobacteriia bacterium]
MEILIFCVFIFGYVAITMEHTLKIDKLIPALLMMAISWAIIALGIDSFSSWFNPSSGQFQDGFSQLTREGKLGIFEETLLHHFGKTAEILIFLMGAMAIVEMIDYFEGFSAMKKMIKTKKKVTLLWVISFLAFALSAIIDNLTATIVLISILRKLIPTNAERMWYAGFIIIAANAGGAWTPIGDVTTTMLWMAGKVTTSKLMTLLILPSLICVLIPVLIASFLPVFKGNIEKTAIDNEENKYGSFMLISGLLLIVFVPVFKTITHLPPYIGMMLSLSIFAILAEIISNRQVNFTSPESENPVPTHGGGPTMKALSKIEIPSVLFFLGILMTVAAMESLGMIFNFGEYVNGNISQNLFITLLGASSAIIDNVPLVAASVGMFKDGTDANVWHFIAYAAGTGGSMLIIGSAAGVVAMGMEKITFFWYLKKIALLAFLGYIGGILLLFLIA